MIEERNREGHKTLESAYSLMQKYGRAMVVRPTGFGKSHILAYLTKRYEKALYIYPLDIIRISMSENYSGVLNNTTFLSYRAIYEMYKRKELRKFLDSNKFGLIMFDEVHMAGSEGFRETIKDFDWAVRKLGTHLIGVTATPDRMDSFDYQSELFRNKRVYEYTLHDCIQNNIMLEPYYVRSSFDVDIDKDKYRQLVLKLKKTVKSDQLDRLIRQKDIEVANLLNASQVINKHVCKVHGEKPEYLKFIVFFSNISNLHETKADVVNWFSDAFPEMSINYIIISSEPEYKNNLNRLAELKPTKGVIDLVFCVDMLNMGYHVDSISGVVLIRGTKSDRIYKQQIGRCLSVKATKRPIIFDFVNNYKCGAFYTEHNTADKNGAYVANRNTDSLTALDLIIEDNLEGYANIMERLSSYGRSYIEEMIVYFYVDRQMPLYLVVEKTKQKREDVKRVLRKYGIELEDESHMRNVVNNKRLLHIHRENN